jgi:hypothetical protein
MVEFGDINAFSAEYVADFTPLDKQPWVMLAQAPEAFSPLIDSLGGGGPDDGLPPEIPPDTGSGPGDLANMFPLEDAGVSVVDPDDGDSEGLNEEVADEEGPGTVEDSFSVDASQPPIDADQEDLSTLDVGEKLDLIIELLVDMPNRVAERLVLG